MLNLLPADLTDACGVSDATPSVRGRDRTRVVRSGPGAPATKLILSRAWSGDKTKHGIEPFDSRKSSSYFILHIYSQMYDDRARARTGHARSCPSSDIAQQTHKTSCRKEHEQQINALALQKSDRTSRSTAKSCANSLFSRLQGRDESWDVCVGIP